MEDIEYKNDENIFSNSILLDCSGVGSGNDDNEFRKYNNPDGENLLIDDKKILIKLFIINDHLILWLIKKKL